MIDEMTSKFAIFFFEHYVYFFYFGSSFANIVIFFDNAEYFSFLSLYHLSYFIFKIAKHTCDKNIEKPILYYLRSFTLIYEG